MISHKEYENAMYFERNRHHQTWEWLVQYFKKYKHLPKETDFLLRWIKNNFDAGEDYSPKDTGKEEKSIL